jgi:hypothetical protein
MIDRTITEHRKDASVVTRTITDILTYQWTQMKTSFINELFLSGMHPGVGK